MAPRSRIRIVHVVEQIQTNSETDRFAFFRESMRTFRTTGAIAPSSAGLAHELARPLGVPAGRPPVRILEVGPGTGVVTRVLAGRLGAADRLDVVELNPRFVRVLREAMRSELALSVAAERIRLHESSILDAPLEPRYDAVVSGLPFTNFDPAEVRAMLQRHIGLLVPGGDLTFFGYLGTGRVRSLVSSRAQARRHRAVEEVLRTFVDRYGVERRTVWRNLPPAHVWHLRSPGQA